MLPIGPITVVFWEGVCQVTVYGTLEVTWLHPTVHYNVSSTQKYKLAFSL